LQGKILANKYLTKLIIMRTKLLERSDSFLTLYQQWLILSKINTLEYLNTKLSDFYINDKSNLIEVFKSETQNVLKINLSDFDNSNNDFLLEFLKEKMIESKYFISLKDERIIENSEQMMAHRYYLKPEIEYLESLKINAFLKFGNLFLEHHFDVDQSYILITANYYSQKKYDSFDKLIEVLFKN